MNLRVIIDFGAHCSTRRFYGGLPIRVINLEYLPGQLLLVLRQLWFSMKRFIQIPGVSLLLCNWILCIVGMVVVENEFQSGFVTRLIGRFDETFVDACRYICSSLGA